MNDEHESRPHDGDQPPGEPREDSITLAGFGCLTLLLSVLGLLFKLLPVAYERHTWEWGLEDWLGVLGFAAIGPIGIGMLCVAWIRRRETEEGSDE